MYRGWLQLAGAELTNTSRLIAHARPDVPQSWEEALAQCACRADYVQYDDSWPGLQDFLGDDPYVLANAPWYDPSVPQSSEFLGYWVLSVEGLGPIPVDRAVSDAICSGGVAGPHRDRYRTITVAAVLVACTNAGVEFGLEWLACQLREAKSLQGTTLEYLAAHPENSAADPALLRRTMSRVVVTREPKVTTQFGIRGSENRQSAVYVADFELTALDPYTYGPAITQTVSWASTVTEQIGWAHPPDCEDPESCAEIPILASAVCVPNVIDVTPVQPPVCSGCIPVCQVQTRVATVPSAVGVLCRDQVVTLIITAGATDASVNFWFRPCGETALCDRVGFLSVAGLPAGTTVVADSVLGRPYGLVGGQQVRQVGIVHTPSGAPWTPTILDSGECWELVAQHEPGADFTVQIAVRGRAA
ncbi:sugar transferase [Nocardia gipuzkoensis]|uniref:sugar transferase n=1 Tax=Nocardia gipuzkoensis TaxID=2749991 RepID=UPI00237E1290|nr:sugar transferase [Nocardia gipuzkoensis]MDE1675128.1 sugar transferase [Nocardia gipuzkoensis]